NAGRARSICILCRHSAIGSRYSTRACFMNRRDFLKISAVVPAIPVFLQQPRQPDPWDETAAILARIKEPVFPNRDFPITNFGGDINAAVIACNAAGGGRVVVPSGNFQTG